MKLTSGAGSIPEIVYRSLNTLFPGLLSSLSALRKKRALGMSDAVKVTHPLSLTLSTVNDLSLVGYYALIICFPVGRAPGCPRERRGDGTVLVVLFSPRGRGAV